MTLRPVAILLLLAAWLALPVALSARPLAVPPAAPTPTPGAAPATLTLIANQPVEITLTGGVPQDLTFEGQRGQYITVSARSLNPALTLDPTAELLNPDGVRVGFNDDLQGTRAGFGALDSVVPEIKLLEDGIYTVRVNSLSGSATGPVEVLVSTGNNTLIAPTPASAYPILTTAERTIQSNAEDCSTVELIAGELLTASAHALDPALDTALTLLAPDGSTLARNDDHRTDNPALGRFDSLIEGVAVPAGGSYTLCVTGFGGTSGPYDLTVQRDAGSAVPDPTPVPTAAQNQANSITEPIVITDTVVAEEVFETEIQAQAGDVFTLTVRALDDGLDPLLGVFQGDSNDMLAGNDDHGTSASDLAIYDSRIQNLIIPETGPYAILVGGYQTTAGPFELTITPTGGGAPIGPPVVETMEGTVPENGVYTQEVALTAGSYVSVTVAAHDDGFDPRTLLITPEGVLAADNDDHGSEHEELRATDSRIRNAFISETGVYTIEVRGYRGAGGSFTLTLETLQ